MKHNHNRDNAPNAGPRLVPVRFEFTHPTAIAVSVAGTFNGWQPTTKSMHPSGDGYWQKETALAPGTYEYCLVVASSPGAAYLASAGNLPLKKANKQKTQRT
jgi:1,4-alpha-glucan branching enzyme